MLWVQALHSNDVLDFSSHTASFVSVARSKHKLHNAHNLCHSQTDGRDE